MRIPVIVLALLLLAYPAQGQTMLHLGREAVTEAVRDARTHAMPPSAPEPRVLADLQSLQRAFGSGVRLPDVLGGVSANYGESTLSNATECAASADGSRRFCAIRDGAIHLAIDSVARTATGYDVIVTTTFTERRRNSSATGHRKVRYSFTTSRGGWVLVEKSTLRRS